MPDHAARGAVAWWRSARRRAGLSAAGSERGPVSWARSMSRDGASVLRALDGGHEVVCRAGMNRDSCLFCKIADKKIPAKIAFENEDVVAFHDINPQAPVHVLVIPRVHVESVDALGDDQGPLVAKLMAAAREVARATGVAKSGFRLVANTGVDGGQSVYHLHLHVLGGRALGWPPG